MMHRGDNIDYDLYHEKRHLADLGDVFERVRARTLASMIRKQKLDLPKDVRLLDVGSGEGRYLPLWAHLFPTAHVIALELSPVASARSAERHPEIEHIVGDAQLMPLANSTVEALVSVEVIEHVPSGRAMLSECFRVLKPGGWAVISTPCGNRGSLEWWLARMTSNLRDGTEDGIHFGDRDDPTHLRRYRSGEFFSLARSAGFVPVDVLFNGHGSTWIGEITEIAVKRRVNLGRRSARLERAFERAVDNVALADWRLLRRLKFGSTMIVVLKKPHAD